MSENGQTRQAAASMIEDGTLDEAGLDVIAVRLSITDRHLRRAFGAEFGVSPVQFAQTQRLLLAKRLLTDTALPVTEVAFASGFGSVRRFNALFMQRYRLRPGQLRGQQRRLSALRVTDRRIEGGHHLGRHQFH